VVVWFDPGMSTGWAVVRAPVGYLRERGQVGAVRHTEWQCGQYRVGEEVSAERTSADVDRALLMARTVYTTMLEVGDVFVLGAESFTLRMLGMDPELLEPVRWLAVMGDRLRGREMWLEQQSPSDALTTITDHRLKAWDMYSAQRHGRDAMRHALLFLRRYASQRRVRDRYWGREISD
jgi:hypothetical protein